MTHAAIVHHADHALAAARAAFEGWQGRDRHLRLFSPPGAALTLGPGYWRALAEAVAAEWPGRPIDCVLDCADDAGAVLAALGEGVRWVRFTGPTEVAGKLAAIAAQQGAELVGDPWPALDLRGADDPLTVCRLAFGTL